ncbi:hypothetical protein BDA96_02G360500 [Sorghum bicolor]|uniref:Uncharacterized protein n=1 Tax=Sorghum bicolor TaxID=4558 RepID=A0A921UXJ3_SORBI|nr:hypothetical protein BDA96_02G360500 [Sorghum bicolor]
MEEALGSWFLSFFSSRQAKAHPYLQAQGFTSSTRRCVPTYLLQRAFLHKRRRRRMYWS